MCFILTLQYVTVTIHICCNRMFQMFHLVSHVCCSKCYSPHALTHGHACATRTQPALPISIIQVSSNSWTCTQVHARMQSSRASWRPCTTRRDLLLCSMQSDQHKVLALCSFYRMQLDGPICTPVQSARAGRRPSTIKHGPHDTACS
jgi:hypothetical protein